MRWLALLVALLLGCSDQPPIPDEPLRIEVRLTGKPQRLGFAWRVDDAEPGVDLRMGEFALYDEFDPRTKIELDSAEDCCGFGGTFSVKYPELSVAMLDRKLEELEAADVEAIVGGEAIQEIVGFSFELDLFGGFDRVFANDLVNLLAAGAGGEAEDGVGVCHLLATGSSRAMSF